MYKDLLRCRACGWGQPVVAEGIKIEKSPERLIPVFDLGLQPFANDFVKEGETRAGFAPLKVLLCPRCSLAQLSVVVDPVVLYRNYRYVTSNSDMMREHFQLLVNLMPLQSHKPKVLEIGSNDGRFLSFLQDEKGWDVAGIDPAENLCKTAHAHGLKVYCDFFGADAAARLQELQPDIIIARHVFCHCDDWKDFMKGIEIMSGPETVTCIEVPYVADLLNKGEFDTIYHEHLSYLSIASMSYLLANTNLRLHRIVPLAIHGGAVLIMITRRDSRAQPHKSVTEAMINENVGEEKWREFAVKAHGKVGAIQSFVDTARVNNKRVVGFGASAKSTVWVNACEFTRRQIAFITDTTPEKLWRLSPGSDIPIVDQGALLREQPDYAIVFAWNYIDEIVQKHSAYLKAGGKFVVPHPEIKVISSDS